MIADTDSQVIMSLYACKEWLSSIWKCICDIASPRQLWCNMISVTSDVFLPSQKMQINNIISLLTGVILPGSTSTGLRIVRLEETDEVDAVVRSECIGVVMKARCIVDRHRLTQISFKTPTPRNGLSLADTWCMHSCFMSRREMNNQAKVTTGCVCVLFQFLSPQMSHQTHFVA